MKTKQSVVTTPSHSKDFFLHKCISKVLKYLLNGCLNLYNQVLGLCQYQNQQFCSEVCVPSPAKGKSWLSPVFPQNTFSMFYARINTRRLRLVVQPCFQLFWYHVFVMLLTNSAAVAIQTVVVAADQSHGALNRRMLAVIGWEQDHRNSHFFFFIWVQKESIEVSTGAVLILFGSGLYRYPALFLMFWFKISNFCWTSQLYEISKSN